MGPSFFLLFLLLTIFAGVLLCKVFDDFSKVFLELIGENRYFLTCNDTVPLVASSENLLQPVIAAEI